MIQPIQLINHFYAVEVPEDVAFKNIKPETGNPQAFWYYTHKELKNARRITLPPGSWQLICTTKDVNRWKASEIVEAMDGGWKDYDTGSFHHDLPFPDPAASLRSLLTSKGLDVNKNYVLIKKLS